jgi:hypothetical protein
VKNLRRKRKINKQSMRTANVRRAEKGAITELIASVLKRKRMKRRKFPNPQKKKVSKLRRNNCLKRKIVPVYI